MADLTALDLFASVADLLGTGRLVHGGDRYEMVVTLSGDELQVTPVAGDGAPGPTLRLRRVETTP